MSLPRFKRRAGFGASAVTLALSAAAMSIPAADAQNLTSNSTGTHNGFYYSFWKDSGDASFELLEGGRYKSQWSNGTNNWVGGKGWNPGGPRVVNYSGSYNVDSSQNSYLALYGWTRSPLIEYYVIESYGSYDPSSCNGGTNYGTFQSDGATYRIRRCERVQQPSIEGTATFYQYFSVREPKKGFGSITGSITVANHFAAWQSAGLSLGSHDYMVLATEGYQSRGSSDITVSEGAGGGSAGGNNGGGNNGGGVAGGNNGGGNNGGAVGGNNGGGNNGGGNNGGNAGGGTGTGGSPSGTDIVVRARGAAGGEHINLIIGNTVVADWTLTTSAADYTYSGGAVGDLMVEYDNDGGDLDVILDYVYVNGEIRQAEDMEYNTATYDGECGGGSYAETMHCNGAIGFGDTGDCFSGSCGGGAAGGNNGGVPTGGNGGGNNGGNAGGVPTGGNNGGVPTGGNNGGVPTGGNNGGVPTGGNNGGVPTGGNNGGVQTGGNNGGQCQCNWYGTPYPLCQSTPNGWGWEDSQSCISTETCNTQGAYGGVVCN